MCIRPQWYGNASSPLAVMDRGPRAGLDVSRGWLGSRWLFTLRHRHSGPDLALLRHPPHITYKIQKTQGGRISVRPCKIAWSGAITQTKSTSPYYSRCHAIAPTEGRRARFPPIEHSWCLLSVYTFEATKKSRPHPFSIFQILTVTIRQGHSD